MSSTPQRIPRAGREPKIPPQPPFGSCRVLGLIPFFSRSSFCPQIQREWAEREEKPLFQPPGGIVKALPGKSPLPWDGASPDPSWEGLRDEGPLLQAKYRIWGFIPAFPCIPQGFLSPGTGSWSRGIFWEGPSSSSSPAYPTPAALPGGSKPRPGTIPGVGMTILKVPSHPKPFRNELGRSRDSQFLPLHIPEPSSSAPSPADPFFQAGAAQKLRLRVTALGISVQELNPPESLPIPGCPRDAEQSRDLAPNLFGLRVEKQQEIGRKGGNSNPHRPQTFPGARGAQIPGGKKVGTAANSYGKCVTLLWARPGQWGKALGDFGTFFGHGKSCDPRNAGMGMSSFHRSAPSRNPSAPRNCL